ncbi:MAG: hypothetical protein A2020_16515 [Lentisphaerae bacterium GWF2_45_14]|nr:MAG: hypothetical protein A2020_16515 [Lentisphaerae bacterium GWF2_45_14]
MFWKDLTEEEKKHLKEQGIITLKDLKKNAKAQATGWGEMVSRHKCCGRYRDASIPAMVHAKA